MPAVGDLFWGNADGAFYNGQPLLPRDTASLDDPLAFLAVPSNAHLLYNISFGRLRSLGSVAAHLTYVARGAAIGALTRRVKLWDLAGVLPILKHTGIELRYLSGAPFDVRDLSARRDCSRTTGRRTRHDHQRCSEEHSDQVAKPVCECSACARDAARRHQPGDIR